jgi:uncharacterized protein YrrD
MPYRFELRSGAEVVGPEGILGKVDRLVVSPGTGEVVGLVVRRGLLARRDLVLPLEAVEQADEERVRVRLTAAELAQLPEFREEEFIEPPPDWSPPGGRLSSPLLFRLPTRLLQRQLTPARVGQTLPEAGGRPLKSGQRVVCRDGELGVLDLVLIDPSSRRATHFVVRAGSALGHDVIVPVEWVREISRDRVYLDVGREQVEQLPEYRPDDEITADVFDALWYGSGIDPYDLQYVEARAHDGIVELTGITRNEEVRARIEEVARTVRGVLGVQNRLATFEGLVRRPAARTPVPGA